jgi:hypothetical protein
LQVSQSKPAKFEDVLSKPEKPNSKKSIHELCRFAGLFSLGSTKNMQFFHWLEHNLQEMSYEQT